MKKKSLQFFTVSFVIMSIVCITVMLFYAGITSRQSKSALYELSSVYMKSINEEITEHFQTTINLRLNELSALVRRNPIDKFSSNEELYNALRVEGELHNFVTLALMSTEGEVQMIYGKPGTILDKGPFLKTLNSETKDEKMVTLCQNEEGGKYVLLGISTELPMDGGQKCTALVAGVPIADLENILKFNNPNLVSYSAIVRRNSDFIVKNYEETEDNYFGRLRRISLTDPTVSLEEETQQMHTAMMNGESYTTVLPLENRERRHIFCSPLTNSNWYVITAIPYGNLDEIISKLDKTRYIYLISFTSMMFVMYAIMFFLYYNMTSKQIQALERANQAKSTFLSNMSHDIRTPMNAISAMTALAKSSIDDKELVSNYLSKISISNSHLLQLINDILDMSKIESGAMHLFYDEMSLRSLSVDIVSIIQQQIKSKSQTFDIAFYDIEAENIYCDSVRLSQVVMNLVSNAMKFTPENGYIYFSMYQTESTLGSEYVKLHIIVKDNGIGMSEEFKGRIFDSFAREDNARIQKSEGTGLGMTITKHIVDAMNGTIEVDSKEQEGTQFHITVDVKKAPDTEKPAIQNLNVLVAEPNEKVRLSTMKNIEKDGHTAEGVYSGFEVIEKAKAKKAEGKYYDIIILCLEMEGLGGIQTARDLKGIIGSETKLILTGSRDLYDVNAEAKEAGIIGFLSKPIFISMLRESYESITGKGKIEKPLFTSQSDLSSLRILVAEDNDMNWEIASALLKKASITTERACNGRECVEIFDHSQPGYYDVILMDLRMPIMTGYEAAVAIRKLNRIDNNIPIIAMTADAFVEDVNRCLECGMDGHISKPIQLQKIIDQLEKHTKKHLEQRQMERQSNVKSGKQQ